MCATCCNQKVQHVRLFHYLTFTLSPSTSTVRIVKSTPIVGPWDGVKNPFVNLFTKHVFPTFASPISIILNKQLQSSIFLSETKSLNTLNTKWAQDFLPRYFRFAILLINTAKGKPGRFMQCLFDFSWEMTCCSKHERKNWKHCFH